MKRLKTHYALLAFTLLAAGSLTSSSSAGSSNDVEQLQHTLETQQEQLDTLKQQIETLQSQNGQRILTADELIPATPAAAHKNSPVLSQSDKHDTESPTASGVSYFGPASGGMVPGEKTKVRVHGLIEFQMMHDSVGLNNNRFDTATIPVDGGPSQTKFSVNPTQLAISSVTAVEGGEINTWLSIDMNGQLDRPEPRLRIAFAEFVSREMGYSILIGQTYSTMLDMRAIPESLDFALPAGLWQQRQPLLRFTKSLSGGVLTEISLETPESVIYADADKLTGLPDLAVAGTWFGSGDYVKHFRVAALARDLQATDAGGGGAEDSALGWALAGSFKLGLPVLGARDNLKFTAHAGDGYGTQLKGGPFEGAFNPPDSTLETTSIVGCFGGLQHFWSEKWRSNLIYGHVDSDNPDFSPGDTYDNTDYASVNLVWAPYKPVTLGVEYLWGRRENKDGANGTSNRLLLSSKVIF